MASTCVYREVHPPTGVTHAVAGFITHLPGESATPNLLVAKTTLLELFRIRCSHENGKQRRDAGRQKHYRLELVARYPLHGVVEGMAVLKSKAPASQHDALMLTFKDAKLSVLEWDRDSHSLATSSMHYFEGDASLKEGREVFPRPPQILGDAAGRFAAMVMYGHQLAVLPTIEADQLSYLAAASRAMSSTASEAVTAAVTAVTAAAGAGGLGTGSGPAGAAEGRSGRAGSLGSAAALGNSFILNMSRLAGGGGSSGSHHHADSREGRRGDRDRGDRDYRASGSSRDSAAGVGGGIRDVRDSVLLNGYNEPVLLVLHEPDPTWPGRYKDRKDTCVATAVSLSVRRKRQTVLWSARGLPSDAFALVAVPDRPAALVLCPHVILYCHQGGTHALVVGRKAVPGQRQPRLQFDLALEAPHVTAAKAARQFVNNVQPELLPAAVRNAPTAAGVEADLRAGQAAWLSPTCCLLGTTSRLLAVHLRHDQPPDKRMRVVPLRGGPVPSALCDLGGGLVFLGSWSGDSLLLEATLSAPDAAKRGDGDRPSKRMRLAAGAHGPGEAPGAGPAAAAAAAAGAAAGQAVKAEAGAAGGGAGGKGEAGDDGGEGEEDDDSDEEDEAESQGGGGLPRVELRVLDSLPGCGPVRDLLQIDTSLAAQQGESSSRGGPTVYAAVGQDKSGAIAVLRPSLITDVITEEPLGGVQGLWAIHHRKEEEPLVEEGGGDPGAMDGALVVANSAQTQGYHAYLLLSCAGRKTMVLETGEELQEVTESSSYITDQPTVAAGNLFNLAGICQVCPRALRVYDGVDPIQDLSLEELMLGAPLGSITIQAAQVRDPYVLLHLSNGTAVLLQGDEFSMTLGMSTVAAQQLSVRPAQDPQALVAAVCLYCDTTGWLTRLLSQPSSAAAPATAAAGDVKQAVAEVAAGAGTAGVLGAAQGGQGEPAAAAATAAPGVKEEPGTGAAGAVGPTGAVPPADGSADAAAGGAAGGAGAMEVDGSAAGGAAGGTAGAGAGAAEEAQAVKAEAGAGGEAGAQSAGAGSGQQEGQGGQVGGGGQMAGESAQEQQQEEKEQDEEEQPAVTYLVVVRRTGDLELYRLPDMELCFLSKQLGQGLGILPQQASAGQAAGGAAAGGPRAPEVHHPSTWVVEVCMESFKGQERGSALHECERPVLLALTASGQLLAYQAFDRGPQAVQSTQAVQSGPAVQPVQPAEGAQDGDVQQPVVVPSPRLAFLRLALDSSGHSEGVAAGAGAAGPPGHRPRFNRFSQLAYSAPDTGKTGPYQSGIFVAGARPLWLVASRGGLVPHPMHVDGPVTAMTPFHNANCPHGFIVSAASGCIRVCQLPPRERLDTDWVVRKVRLGGTGTVHRLAHVKEAGLLAVATSRVVPFRPRLPEEPGGDPHASAAYAAAAAAAEQAGKEEVHEVRLLQLPGLNAAPGLPPLGLLPGEAVTALRMVYLKDAASENVRPYLAIGTAMTLGDDYPCLGRVALYTLERTTKHLGQGRMESGWAATLVTQRDMAGPVTSLQDFRSMLLATVGKAVELYVMRPGATPGGSSTGSGHGGPVQLVKSAFYDNNFLVSGLAVVKDFLLVGDIHKGVAFVRYNEASKVLELLSRDYDQQDVVSVGFVINGPKLLFALADSAGALRLMEYVRSHPASWTGDRLLHGGSLHIGQLATRMAGARMATPDGANRHSLLVATASGSFGLWCPVWDPAAAGRLAALHAALISGLPHTAGLNPRAFRRRHLHTPRSLGGGTHFWPQWAPSKPGEAPPEGTNPSLWPHTGSCILDGDLLWRFLSLPRPLQRALAAAAGLCPPVPAAAVGAGPGPGGAPGGVQAGQAVDQVLTDLAALSLAVTL